MFRFTIRDVLWLTVVVALAVGWWLDRDRVWRHGEHHRQLVARFQKFGVELEPLLRDLEAVGATPPVRVIKLKRRPAVVPGSNRPSNSDYQFPPRPPLRVSDEERQ